MNQENRAAPQRIVIFTHGVSQIAAVHIRSVLAAVQADSRVELAAICLPRVEPFRNVLLRHIKARIGNRILSLFDPDLKKAAAFPMPVNIRRTARQFNFRVLVPPDKNFSNPEFIAQLRDEIRPDIALSFNCIQRLSPELLEIFDHAVNYHTGLLPGYRGRRATAWTVYHAEKVTGFSFHTMTEKFDAGSVLLDGAIPILPGANVSNLELQKAVKAAECIPQLLDMITAGHPGRPQQGSARYFSLKDAYAAREIPDPTARSSTKLKRTLQAFGRARIKIGDTWYSVTKIRQVPKNQSQFCFRSSDGIWMEATRFKGLPYPLHRATRFLVRVSRRVRNRMQ